jgi:hypothetical protein
MSRQRIARVLTEVAVLSVMLLGSVAIHASMSYPPGLILPARLDCHQ